eukprot:3931719-Rhodomonas_salina.1
MVWSAICLVLYPIGIPGLLSAYVLATPSPVLTWPCATAIFYCLLHYFGASRIAKEKEEKAMVLFYPRPMRRPVLTHSDSMSCYLLRACYAMPGTDISSGATAYQGAMRFSSTDTPHGSIALHACYPVSGTDLAYGSIGLCACYAVSGTDVAYGALPDRSRAGDSAASYGRQGRGLRPEIKYKKPQSQNGMRVLRDVRYSPSVWYDAATGTILGLYTVQY